MTILRRRRLLEPLPITSSPAPQLGDPVDVVGETRGAIAPGVYRSTPDGLVPVRAKLTRCHHRRATDGPVDR